MFPHGITLDVLATSRDRHGDETTTVRGSIPGCGLAPDESVENAGLRAQEDTHQRALVITRQVVYAPPSGVRVGAQDRVRLVPPGTSPEARAALPLWHVEGEPELWQNPMTGWRPGRVIRLQRVTG